jgi:hypothetical protein
MGLLRGVARTAVIAGTATAVSNRVSRRQGERWQTQADAEAYRQGGAAAPAPAQYAEPAQYAPPPAPEPVDPTTAQLQQLAQLKAQGILTEEEFTAKKKQILGI